MKFKPNISKEDVNQLPVEAFEGEVIVVDDESKVVAAVQYIREQEIVGIDTETRPSFTKGIRYKVALVQISTLDRCYLFRLNKMNYPKEMFDFLADSSIKKIGLSLRDDLIGLSKYHRFHPRNFIDLQSIAQDYGILELSLQKMYAIVFGKKISKSQRLTNWECDELTVPQQIYAATDAWACVRIYQQLQQEKKLMSKEIIQLKASLIPFISEDIPIL